MSIELFQTSAKELQGKDGEVVLKDLDKVRNIEKYLSGAVSAMGGAATAYGAAKKAAAYAREADLSEFKKDTDHTLKMMGKVENTLKEAASSYDTKTKIAYALGGAERMRAVVLGAASAVAGVAGANGAEPMMAASLILGAGAFCTYVDSFTPDGKSENKQDLREYTQIKHAQIALKKMKKALTGEPTYMEQVGKLFADGYGNPGGMVTVPPSKDVRAPSEEKKADGKSSYWQEVKKLFADGYGNPGGMVTVPPSKDAPAPSKEKKTDGKPSYWQEVKRLIAEGYGNPGGMVTVPMSKDEVKTDTTQKPAENKGKASSYKEEVTKLYANFGNPSGGFVHNALADKKRSR